MKQLLLLAGLIVISALLGGTVMAASDATTVTITVDYVDILVVPTSQAMILTATVAGATAYTEDSNVDNDGFLYTHNSISSTKITAVAVKDSGNAANTITLTVAVESGAGAQTIVNVGTDVGGGAVVWTGIAAGGYTKDITWTANGTVAGTTAGASADKNYIWTVTFTSTDV